MKYELIRNVSIEECDWLDREFEKGEIVYSYGGATYGCIGQGGVAVALELNKTPFFELPENSIEEINE